MSVISDDARTEEFLEHVGVKGMKWGVRKPDDEGSSGGSGGSGSSGIKKERTPEEQAARSARNKKIAKNVAIGTAVVGAGVAAYMLKKHGSEKMSNIADSAKMFALNKAKEGIKAKATDALTSRVQDKFTPQQPSRRDIAYQAGINAQLEVMKAAGSMKISEINSGPAYQAKQEAAQQLTAQTWENSARLSQTEKRNEAEWEETMASLAKLNKS